MFDLRVHKRNKKGKITRVEPYRLHIDGGEQRFERPPGSGQFFSAAGEALNAKAKQALAEQADEDTLAVQEELAALKEQVAQLQAVKEADAKAMPEPRKSEDSKQVGSAPFAKAETKQTVKAETKA